MRAAPRGGLLDRYIDLRVDDHPAPIGELARLLKLHRFYLTPPREEDLLPIDQTIAGELQELLARAGYYHGPANGVYDTATRAALDQYGGVENLEERLISPTHIDPRCWRICARRSLSLRSQTSQVYIREATRRYAKAF